MTTFINTGVNNINYPQLMINYNSISQTKPDNRMIRIIGSQMNLNVTNRKVINLST